MKSSKGDDLSGIQFYYFSKMPKHLDKIIKRCGFKNNNWLQYAMLYLFIMEVFYEKQTRYGDISLSVLKEGILEKVPRSSSIDKIINQKWLFYVYPAGGESDDSIVQPLFDMSRMTPKLYVKAIRAVEYNDYCELTKLIPLRMRSENCKTAGDACEAGALQDSADVPQERCADDDSYENSQRGAQQGMEQGAQQGMERDTLRGTEHGTSGDNNMYARLDKRQETRDKRKKEMSSSKTMTTKKISSSSSDENKFNNFSREKALDDCLAEMDVGSFEAQEILAKCAAHRQFYTDNFKFLKIAFRNWCVMKGKPDKCTPEDIRTYFAYVMASPRMEKLIFDDVEQKQRRAANKYHVSTDPRYPYDLLNEQGLRVSQGKVIPQDAPPKPTRTAIWMDGGWMLA